MHAADATSAEMAYKPRMTIMRGIAEERGWSTICGVEVVLVRRDSRSNLTAPDRLLTLCALIGRLLRYVAQRGLEHRAGRTLADDTRVQTEQCKLWTGIDVPFDVREGGRRILREG